MQHRQSGNHPGRLCCRYWTRQKLYALRPRASRICRLVGLALCTVMPRFKSHAEHRWPRNETTLPEFARLPFAVGR